MDALGNAILLQVFHNISQPPHRDIDSWNAALPLLGVCSKWRQILVAEVYGYAYIFSSQVHGDVVPLSVSEADILEELEEIEDDIVHIPEPEPDEHVEWITNLDLLLSSPAVYAIHTVYLDLYDVKSKFYNLLNAAKLIKHCPLPWSYASKLYLSTTHLPGFNVPPSVQTRVNKREVYIAKQLVSQLPNITALEFTGLGASRSVNSLNLSIMILYSKQLYYLDSCTKPIHFPQQVYLGCITHLSICAIYCNVYRLCKVFAGSLVYLKLDSTGPNFPWYQFCDYDDKPGLVYFARLQTFHFKCIDIKYISSHPVRAYCFYFPSLQNLHIDVQSHGYHLLSNSMFPCHLRQVKFCGDIVAASYLAFSGIQRIDQLSVTLNVPESDSSIDCAALVPVMNQLYSSSGIAVNASLHINNRFVAQACLEQQDWSKLTCLSVCMLPQLSMLIHFINRMPALHKLRIYYAYIFDFEQQQAKLGPVTINIKHLAVVCPRVHQNVDNALDDLFYFAKISPSIEQLYAGDFPKALFEDLIEENKAEYPHLAKIIVY